MNFFVTVAAIVLTASAVSSWAEESHSKRIEIPRGKSHTQVTGQIAGRGTVVYKLNAKAGQFLKSSRSKSTASRNHGAVSMMVPSAPAPNTRVKGDPEPRSRWDATSRRVGGGRVPLGARARLLLWNRTGNVVVNSA